MATTEELANYYRDLLILQWKGKTKARDTIVALATLVLVDQLPQQVQDAFNLDTAEGVQLDVIGKIVGATRYGRNFSGPVTLSDDDFRDFITLCVALNTLESNLSAVRAILTEFFPDIIVVFDHLGMRINYFFDSSASGTELAQFFVMSGRLPRPLGVQLGAIVYAPTHLGYFGYARNLSGAYNSTGFSRNTGFVGKQLRNGDFL